MFIDRKQVLIGLLLVCVILFGVGYKAGQGRTRQVQKPVVVRPVDEKKPPARSVMVHITGAVKKPGVYSFTEGARVVDGVNRAGPTKDAALDCINLAEIMVDQQSVHVPLKSEIAANPGAAGPGPGQSASVGRRGSARPGKVNINRAGADELDTLPGIGPSFAGKIITYRNQHGGFKSIEELGQVPGIGEKKLSQLKDLVTI